MACKSTRKRPRPASPYISNTRIEIRARQRPFLRHLAYARHNQIGRHCLTANFSPSAIGIFGMYTTLDSAFHVKRTAKGTEAPLTFHRRGSKSDVADFMQLRTLIPERGRIIKLASSHLKFCDLTCGCDVHMVVVVHG